MVKGPELIDHTFSGGVFSETLAHGRAGAEIELAVGGVSARVPSGETFFVPYRDCQVELGGNSGRMVFCRDGDRTVTIFCEDRKFPAALSLASSGTLDGQLGESLRKRRRASRRDRTVLLGVLVGFWLLIVAGYFGVRIGARAAVKALPTSVDRQIGSTAFESMDLGGPEIKDEIVLGAMQSIVDRLTPHAAIDGMEFDVHVVDSPTINAFALPGGKIVVFTGLIKNAENIEQVAAVLGHEMSHATLRHGIERMGQSMGIYAAVSLLVGDAGGLIAMAADLFQVASINSYSREQENAADEEGVRMLHSAGIDPMSMATFFELLEKQHGDLPDAIAWISTHPDHASRIENVESMVAALPEREYQPFEIDWPSVQVQLQVKE